MFRLCMYVHLHSTAIHVHVQHNYLTCCTGDLYSEWLIYLFYCWSVFRIITDLFYNWSLFNRIIVPFPLLIVRIQTDNCPWPFLLLICFQNDYWPDLLYCWSVLEMITDLFYNWSLFRRIIAPLLLYIVFKLITDLFYSWSVPRMITDMFYSWYVFRKTIIFFT
jgi:hypothetical protein